MRLADLILEPLQIAGRRPARDECRTFAERIGLTPEVLDRHPYGPGKT